MVFIVISGIFEDADVDRAVELAHYSVMEITHKNVMQTDDESCKPTRAFIFTNTKP